MIFSFLLRPADAVAVKFVTEEPPTPLFSFFLHEMIVHSYKNKLLQNSQKLYSLAKVWHYLSLFGLFDKAIK